MKTSPDTGWVTAVSAVSNPIDHFENGDMCSE